jgi:hypothetical protein
MRPNVIVGMSSLVAVALCLLSAVGSPPSEFVETATIWRRLEPLMFPVLSLGILLAVVGVVLAPFKARAAAVSCISASIASVAGSTIAWGNDAQAQQAGLHALVWPIVPFAIPVLGGLVAFRQARAVGVVPSTATPARDVDQRP